MDIKKLIKNTIDATEVYNSQDFVAIQFISNEKQQYYILSNKLGQKDIILDWINIKEFIEGCKKVNIINIDQLDEETKENVLKRIKQIYITMLEIK